MDKVSNQFRLMCKKCRCLWVAALLPMEVGALVKKIRYEKCPSCGAGQEHLNVYNGKIEI